MRGETQCVGTLVRVRITSVGGCERVAWAEGSEVTLPTRMLDLLDGGAARQSGALVMARDTTGVTVADAVTLRLCRAFTDHPPSSSRLPVSYQLVPGRVRSLVASVVGRWNRTRSYRWARFPAWPLDLSADFLADVAGIERPTFDGGRTPVLVSHDLDSPEGLANLVKSFLPIEEAAGVRSTNFVVPCGWAIDHGLLGEVHGRGHEVGVHGYDHANRTPFADDSERQRRLDAAWPLAERYGAIGYRAPSLLRTRPLLRDLAARYRYDSSIPTSGGLFPVPNTGCASARPFRIEGITEIPVTLPRDGSLRFLGHSPREIAGIWIECAHRIATSGGIVMLLTHCERRFSGTPPMLEAYQRFIDAIAAQPEVFAWRLPADIVGMGAGTGVRYEGS